MASLQLKDYVSMFLPKKLNTFLASHIDGNSMLFSDKLQIDNINHFFSKQVKHIYHLSAAEIYAKEDDKI